MWRIVDTNHSRPSDLSVREGPGRDPEVIIEWAGLGEVHHTVIPTTPVRRGLAAGEVRRVAVWYNDGGFRYAVVAPE